MEHRVLVGGSLRQSWFLGLVLSAVVVAGCGVGLLVWRANRPLRRNIVDRAAAKAKAIALSTFVLAGAMTVGGVIVLRRQRRWLEVEEQACTVFDRHGERRIEDAAVATVKASVREHFSQGQLKAITRRLVLAAPGPLADESLALELRVRIEEYDLLGLLADRLDEAIYRRVKAARLAGEPVEGEGWTLMGDELLVRSGKQSALLKISSLSAVSAFDGRLSVWRRGEVEPAASLPLDAANLGALKRSILDEIVATEPDPPKPGELGRLLFTRGPAAWMKPMRRATVAAIVLAVLAAVALAIARYWEGASIAAAFGAGGGLLYLLLADSSAQYRFHEAGVSRRPLYSGNDRRVLLSDLKSIVYTLTDRYYNGIYAGTQMRLRLGVTANGRMSYWSYSQTMQRTDNDIETYHTLVSRHIAARIWNELQGGATVEWVPRLFFSPDGLLSTPRSFFGGKQEAVLTPFRSIHDIGMDRGQVSIYVVGKKRRHLRLSAAAPNFHAGLMVLERLIDGGDSAFDATSGKLGEMEA